MKNWTWTMALAGAALASLIAVDVARAQTAEPAAPAAPAASAPAAAPAEAAPKEATAKKKAAAKSGSRLSVPVWNSRSADLTELQVAESGSPSFKKVLGKLKAGKKTNALVPKGKDCQIDLHATFADGETTEASGVDVCTERVLNLTN
jgi:glucose/arabinose dehydrogenase